MNRLLVVLLLVLCHSKTWAYPDSLLADEYMKKAIAFVTKGDARGALEYENQAAQIFRANDDLTGWIRLHRRIGQTWRDSQHNDNAALAKFQTVLEQGWRKPKTTTEHKQTAWLYADIGYTHKNLMNLQAVTEHYEKAAAIFTDTLLIENDEVAKYIYSELGNAYNRLRDYEKAAFYHKRRKEILLQAQKWDDAAGAFNDLGMVYLNLENYPEAIRVFSEGLEVEPIKGASLKALLMVNLSLAYLYNNESQKALYHTRRCEQFVRSADLSKQQKTEHLIWLFDNYAKYFAAKKDYPNAEKYYTTVIIELGKTDVHDLRALALAHISRGNLYLNWNKPEAALKDHRTALQLFLPDFTDKTQYAMPAEGHLVAEPNLIDALGSMANSFAALQSRGLSGDLAEKAVRSFDLAAKVEALMLQFYILEGSRQTALREHHWIKSDHLSFIFDLWGKEQALASQEKMFSISEQSRAYLLWEGIELNKLFGSESVSAMGADFRLLNKEIESLEQEMYDLPENRDKKRSDSLEMRLLKAREKKAGLVKQVASKLPDAGFAKQRTPISLNSVKESLHENQALIEYFIHGQNAFVFVVPAGKEQPSVIKLSWDARLSDMATTLKDDILAQNNAAYIQKARALYDHLVKPVLALTRAEHLIVVPDGELWNLPFDALLTRDISEKEQRNFKNFPYLLLDKSISYGFSATLQYAMSQAGQNQDAKSLQAYAPSYWKINTPKPVKYAYARNQLDTLLYNIEEAKTIARISGGEFFDKAQASKNDFWQNIFRANVLHLAGHAKANHQNPNFSFIAFSNTGDTLREPYRLYVHEIYNQPLPLRMVVLSACETGTGPVWKGEGVISLARAFAYSGAQSIVTTLWSIDDKATQIIMVDFYKNLQNGQSKNDALRNAKLSYIRQALDQNRAHPLYWAAFTPLGDMEPVQLGGAFPWSMVLLCGALAAVLGVWLYRKRKQSVNSPSATNLATPSP